MKVVIADDSDLVRIEVRKMLSEFPEITFIGEARDGPEALMLIEQCLPDLVILDVRMPGGNGVDVLKKITKVNGRPVVIMLTNYPYPQYRKKCKELGADFFFDKSTEFKECADVCGTLIHASHIGPV